MHIGGKHQVSVPVHLSNPYFRGSMTKEVRDDGYIWMKRRVGAKYVKKEARGCMLQRHCVLRRLQLSFLTARQPNQRCYRGNKRRRRIGLRPLFFGCVPLDGLVILETLTRKLCASRNHGFAHGHIFDWDSRKQSKDRCDVCVSHYFSCIEKAP